MASDAGPARLQILDKIRQYLNGTESNCKIKAHSARDLSPSQFGNETHPALSGAGSIVSHELRRTTTPQAPPSLPDSAMPAR